MHTVTPDGEHVREAQPASPSHRSTPDTTRAWGEETTSAKDTSSQACANKNKTENYHRRQRTASVPLTATLVARREKGHDRRRFFSSYNTPPSPLGCKPLAPLPHNLRYQRGSSGTLHASAASLPSLLRVRHTAPSVLYLRLSLGYGML